MNCTTYLSIPVALHSGGNGLLKKLLKQYKLKKMETVINTVWQKSKLIIKGFVIFVMAILLLIPASFVQNLVKEREQRQKEAFAEVSSKWANRQNLSGPILVVPFSRSE